MYIYMQIHSYIFIYLFIYSNIYIFIYSTIFKTRVEIKLDQKISNLMLVLNVSNKSNWYLVKIVDTHFFLKVIHSTRILNIKYINYFPL